MSRLLTATFLLNLFGFCAAIRSSQTSPTRTSLTLHQFVTEKLGGCANYVKLRITEPVQTEVYVCRSPLSNGMVGFVFRGLVLCRSYPDPRFCNAHYNTNAVPVLSDATDVIGARRVAVKFNKPPGEDGKVHFVNSPTDIRKLRSDMALEISNLGLLQQAWSPYVKLFGFIGDLAPENRRFYRLPTAAAGKRPQFSGDLESKGLVMEYLEGTTAEASVLAAKNVKEKSEMFSCYLLQFLLAHEFELDRGVYNSDLHWKNAIALNSGRLFRPAATSKDGKKLPPCKRLKFIDVGQLKTGLKAGQEIGLIMKDSVERTVEKSFVPANYVFPEYITDKITHILEKIKNRHPSLTSPINLTALVGHWFDDKRVGKDKLLHAAKMRAVAGKLAQKLASTESDDAASACCVFYFGRCRPLGRRRT